MGTEVLEEEERRPFLACHLDEIWVKQEESLHKVAKGPHPFRALMGVESHGGTRILSLLWSQVRAPEAPVIWIQRLDSQGR